MNGRMARTLLVIAIVVTVGLMGNAHAVQLPFGDGFENTAPGAYPTHNGWITLLGGGSGFVSNQVAHSGSNSLRLDSRPFRPRAEYVRLDSVPDCVSYEASVYLDPEQGRVARVGFVKGYFGEAPMWNYFEIDGRNSRVAFYGVNRWDLGSYSPGNWCTLRADLDYVALKADLWADGTRVAANVAITPREFYEFPWAGVVLNQLGLGCPSNDDFGDWFMGNVVYFDDVGIREWLQTLMVQVDVKPGSTVNPVNLGSRGLLPVAIFSTESFDATRIDPATVEVAGAGIAVRGKGGKYMAHPEDVNQDGLVDLVIHVETQALDPGQLQDGYAVVTGATYAGERFQGADEVRLVPPA